MLLWKQSNFYPIMNDIIYNQTFYKSGMILLYYQHRQKMPNPRNTAMDDKSTKSITQMPPIRVIQKVLQKKDQEKPNLAALAKGSFLPSHQTIVYPDKLWRLIIMMCVVCLSPFYVGFTIFMSASVSEQSFKQYYQHTLNDWVLCFSMINGVVPLGGMVGSMTLPYVMRFTTKRGIYFIFLGCSALFCGITLIPYFEALLVGRFLLGIICSWENSMGATLIRDLTPIQMRSLFGAFYLTSRVSGITFSFVVGLAFDYNLSTVPLCLVNYIPAFLALVQLILIRIFVPVVPADLINKSEFDELKKFFLTLYSEQHATSAMNNCIRQFKAPSKIYSYVHINKREQQKELAKVIYQRIQNKAFFVSQSICLLRQFCGVNYLTLYTRNVLLILQFNKIANAGPVLINLIQIAATFVGLFLCHRFCRRPLLNIGVAGAFVSTLLIAIFDLCNIYEGVIGAGILYMLFIGSTVSPIAWPYPPELIPPVRVKYNSLISWTGSTIIAIIPIENKSFIFFFSVSGYLLLTGIINYIFLIESKNLTLRQVVTEYMRQAYEKIKRIDDGRPIDIQPQIINNTEKRRTTAITPTEQTSKLTLLNKQQINRDSDSFEIPASELSRFIDVPQPINYAQNVEPVLKQESENMNGQNVENGNNKKNTD